ncbi:hypothetical protein ACGFRG_10985 [Streptomyces sp. NPDC048696]|uniref:hypothetical protein n=1 Tax=Streptomyces sp. NPDC048696 TaxID=3365585 RepID=UPI00371F92BC
MGLDEPVAPYKASAVFAFVLTTDAQHDDSVTVDQLAQAFPEIGTSTTPPVPFTVPAGGTVRVVVRLTARSCSGFPLDPELPYLDTTLTNNYATQQHSYLFDGRYARDLSRYLHTICPSTPLTRTAVVSPIVTH